MTTYYVETWGNDTTGDGSAGNPWLTVLKAYNSSAADDTIMIGAGTHLWQSMSWTSARTIQGQGIGVTILDSNNGAASGWLFYSGTVLIRGITFTDSTVPLAYSSYLYGSTGLTTFTVRECSFDTLMNGTSSYNGNVAIISCSGLNYTVYVIGCTFSNIKKTSSICSYQAFLYNTASVKFYNINNTYYETNSTPPSGWGYVGGINNSDNEVYHYNCVFHNNSGGTLNLCGSGGTQVTVRLMHNCCYYAESGAISLGNLDDLQDNLNVDPQMVDPDNGLFQPAYGSPLFDAGKVL